MKWILTGIDTFSKMAFGVPLPNKTENAVLKGMEAMLGSLPMMPSVI